MLNGHNCRIEYDSGARVSTINRDCWEKLGKPKLKMMTSKLTSYGKNIICTMSKVELEVGFDNNLLKLAAFVVNENVVWAFMDFTLWNVLT